MGGVAMLPPPGVSPIAVTLGSGRIGFLVQPAKHKRGTGNGEGKFDRDKFHEKESGLDAEDRAIGNRTRRRKAFSLCQREKIRPRRISNRAFDLENHLFR